jgi:hypothetical protein
MLVLVEDAAEGADGAEPNAYMWATAEESRDWIVGLYRRWPWTMGLSSVTSSLLRLPCRSKLRGERVIVLRRLLPFSRSSAR